MFTGIIEDVALIQKTAINGSNKSFWLSTIKELQFKIDQSVSHNGVCLTVEEVIGNQYKVTAIAETLAKTNLNTWEIGTKVNIEQCMPANGRFDGHFVSGHVDTTAACIAKEDQNGSWLYTFEIQAQYAANIIEKGSIAINGTSLTIFNITNQSFTVAIIPYTYEHTTIHEVQVGSLVNIEFDLIGKYITRSKALLNV
jgi:riboflavin synthase